MTDERYPEEILGEDWDDGTMPANVEALAEAVVGRRIVHAEKITAENFNPRWFFKNRNEVPYALLYGGANGVIITLDNEKKVLVVNTSDCCAHTTLENFLLNAESVNHMILGVGTTDEYCTWHIYADFGDMMTLDVSWSCGNPFYYGYGFEIKVVELLPESERGTWEAYAWES